MCVVLNLFEMPIRASDCDVVINLKGFFFFFFHDFRLSESVEKNVIIDNKEEAVLLKSYVLKEHNDIKYRDIILVDSQKVLDYYSSISVELKYENLNSIRFWVDGFTACYRKSDMKILYYDLWLLTNFSSDIRTMKEVLYYKKIYGKVDPENLGVIADYRSYFVLGGGERGVVYDSDSDGIFESFFFFPIKIGIEGISDEEYDSKDIHSILKCACMTTNEPSYIRNFVSAWRNYREKPSSESAKNFLDAIPTQSIDRMGILFRPEYVQLKKRIEERGEKVETITPYEKGVWLFIEDNLAFIKRQAYLGDPNAVRILFKLYRTFYKSYLFQGKIDQILDELSLVNPTLFLAILNENKDLDLSVLLDIYTGLDYVNETNDRYENLKNKIDVFNKVSDSALMEIRNNCLSVLMTLKKEIEKSGLLIKATN